MKPVDFAYRRPRTVVEALQELAEGGAEVAVLAGGQSLVPAMNRRHRRPTVVVDINRVRELSFVRVDGDFLCVGALARQQQLLADSLVESRLPALTEAARMVGHQATRNRGTLGGSIAYGDPAGELPSMSVALEAGVVLRSVRGERTVPASEFFVGEYRTVREPDELLSEIRFPLEPAFGRSAVVEFSRRAQDFAIAGAITLLDLEPSSGTVRRSRVVAFGAGTTPVRLTELEKYLQGGTCDSTAMSAVRDIVRSNVDPVPHIWASAAYRRELVATMCERSILQAAKGDDRHG